jgi:hypothetical protein
LLANNSILPTPKSMLLTAHSILPTAQRILSIVVDHILLTTKSISTTTDRILANVPSTLATASQKQIAELHKRLVECQARCRMMLGVDNAVEKFTQLGKRTHLCARCGVVALKLFIEWAIGLQVCVQPLVVPSKECLNFVRLADCISISGWLDGWLAGWLAA